MCSWKYLGVEKPDVLFMGVDYPVPMRQVSVKSRHHFKFYVIGCRAMKTSPRSQFLTFYRGASILSNNIASETQ
jgi:hypothetical protein